MFRTHTGHYSVDLFTITKAILSEKLQFMSSDNIAMIDCFSVSTICRNFFFFFFTFNNVVSF